MRASGVGREAAGWRRKANGVNTSPLRLGGLYSHRSLSFTARLRRAAGRRRFDDDISLMSRTHLIQSAKSA